MNDENGKPLKFWGGQPDGVVDSVSLNDPKPTTEEMIKHYIKVAADATAMYGVKPDHFKMMLDHIRQQAEEIEVKLKLLVATSEDLTATSIKLATATKALKRIGDTSNCCNRVVVALNALKEIEAK